VTQARRGPLGRKELKVTRAYKVSRAHPEQMEHRDPKAIPALRDPQVMMERSARLDLRDPKVIRDRQDLRGVADQLDMKL